MKRRVGSGDFHKIRLQDPAPSGVPSRTAARCWAIALAALGLASVAAGPFQVPKPRLVGLLTATGDESLRPRVGDCRTVLVPAGGNCADVSGEWEGEESGELVCMAMGEQDREPFRQSGRVTIQQQGCNVSYRLPSLPGVPEAALTRTGTVSGNEIWLTGQFVLAPPEGFQVIDQSLEAHGTALDDQIELDSSGHAVFRTPPPENFQVTCTVTSHASLTAVRYRLEAAIVGMGIVRSEPSGLECAARCGADFRNGRSIVLRAAPLPDWRFDHWEGDCQGVEPNCALQMDRDRTATAFFVLDLDPEPDDPEDGPCDDPTNPEANCCPPSPCNAAPLILCGTPGYVEGPNDCTCPPDPPDEPPPPPPIGGGPYFPPPPIPVPPPVIVPPLPNPILP